MLDVPVDVLDYILNFLQSDTATLEACSRSHRVLSQLVERYLYADVTIEDIHGPNHLYQVLRSRPHVAKYIRTLTISFRKFRRHATYLDKISLILPKFLMLRKVVFVYQVIDRELDSTWHMSEKFRLTFLECLRLPCVTDIGIKNLCIPLSTLNGCRHLRELTLQQGRNADIGGDNSRPPTIDSLVLYQCSSEYLRSIAGLLQSFHLSSVTFLAWGSLQCLGEIFGSCSLSLTTLDVNLGYGYATRYQFHKFTTARRHCDSIPLSPWHFPILQQLTIRFQPFYDTETRQFTSSIPTITEVVKRWSSIRRLALNLRFGDFLSGRDQRNVADAFCGSLHSLFIKSASTIDSIKLYIIPAPRASADHTISLFTGHPDLRSFVENGRLILIRS